MRFLYQAFLAGTSVEGLTKVGQAFTGISPIIIQPMKQYPRWKLSVYTGSVTYVGSDFIISDVNIPGVGYILPTAIPGSFSVGSKFTVSYSHLGTSTKLGGEQYLYDTLEATFFTSFGFSSEPSDTSALENLAYGVIKADQVLRISYSNNFAYYRPQAVSSSIPITNVLTLSPLGYIYNSGRIFGTGAVVQTDVVPLPTGYQNHDWYYDWLVSHRDTAHYTTEIRNYPSSSIPDTVYFKSVDKSFPELLHSFPLEKQAHWQFSGTGSIWDISGNLNNLSYQSGSAQRIQGRIPNSLGMRGNYTYGSQSVARLNFTKSMRTEIWASGVDNACNGGEFFIETSDVGGDYYKVGIDASSQNLFLDVSIGGSGSSANASVANWFAEAPLRYHYFTISFASGSVFFTVDGKLLATGSLPGLPSIINGTTTLSNSCNIGVDEVLLGEEFLFPYDELQNFENSKERINHLGTSSGSVDQFHQAKFTLYAYGEKDIEFHQFSIRGFDTPYYRSAENRYWELLQLPMYNH